MNNICKICGRSFKGATILTRHCSKNCSRLAAKEKYYAKRKSDWDRTPRICEYSGEVFIPKAPNQKYANSEYTLLAQRQKRLEQLGVSPEDYYVYAWYDDDECFYIGKGKGPRYIVSHFPALCETIRQESSNFRVEIVKEGLTESQAFLAESVLIAFARPRANVASGVHPKKLK